MSIKITLKRVITMVGMMIMYKQLKLSYMMPLQITKNKNKQ